ncbi:hypothetical protein B9479_000987 [Cryptococcus floricola]|uniref:Uncharacterized protein n=1 Tax=Cryptococcus floricola TaxID=2591691 RepID=A0A5D3B7M3_9TREE|nr:hypothetical protein B9479_000987 [Cryptococcus floricola]
MSLHNISQIIHAHQLVPTTKFLLTSSLPNRDDPDEWRMCLFWIPNDGREVKVWKVDQRISDTTMNEAQLVKSIQSGMMSVKLKATDDPNAKEELYLHMIEPKKWLSCLEEDEIGKYIPDLMRVIYKLLDPESEGWTGGGANQQNPSTDERNTRDKTPPPKPKTPEPARPAPDINPQIREMQEQLAQAQAQINAFSSQQAKASQGGPGKSSQQSPVKPKAPKNANRLQPTQKRRKIVEDEFAGSSDSDY